MAMDVLAVIPARGGSKGLPGKNIRDLAGRPLIAHSIAAAQAVRPPLRKILVSTDDAAIANVARDAGAEVPFMRPPELAGDTAGSMEVVRHAVEWIRRVEGWEPRWLLLLQPTSPLRTVSDIEAALSIATCSPCDSVIGVSAIAHGHPRLARRIDDGRLAPYFAATDTPTRRQELDPAYYINGAIYLTRIETIDDGSFYGEVVRPYVMPAERAVDIDTEFDLRLAACLLDGND